MPRTALTPQTLKGPYPGTVSANDLDITWAAGDDANENEFTCTGKDLILVRNDDAGAQTFSLLSVEDKKKRKGDVTNYSVGAGEYAGFWVGSLVGWDQGAGKFHIDVSSNNLMFAILRLPL